MSMIAPRAGPMLFLRAVEPDAVRVAAICIRGADEAPPEVSADRHAGPPERLAECAGLVVWRSQIALGLPEARYTVDGEEYSVATDFLGDVTFAFASCNGQETGDFERSPEERNALWSDLARRRDEGPIHLLLHGGDQIYADEVTQAHPLSAGWPDDVNGTLTEDEAAALRESLRQAYFRRYAVQLGQAGFADVVARVPSLCIWDDHDICDGWGSLPPEALDSDVGHILFDAAREAYLLFQHGCRADERPPLTLDGAGDNLPWRIDLPGVTVMAPDLRSTRRPDRVMDDYGWQSFEATVDALTAKRVLLISSVPALGPRLSWVERLMNAIPGAEAYEDDLRDQWQSWMHRKAWIRFLGSLRNAHESDGRRLTVLSGEIHLATRAEMYCKNGPMHQLVASGITHPPPPNGYARGLGLLAGLGEAPLAGHPIRIRPLPDQRRRYVNERNYLILRRRAANWSASWQLEDSGETPELPI